MAFWWNSKIKTLESKVSLYETERLEMGLKLNRLLIDKETLANNVEHLNTQLADKTEEIEVFKRREESLKIFSLDLVNVVDLMGQAIAKLPEELAVTVESSSEKEQKDV